MYVYTCVCMRSIWKKTAIVNIKTRTVDWNAHEWTMKTYIFKNVRYSEEERKKSIQVYYQGKEKFWWKCFSTVRDLGTLQLALVWSEAAAAPALRNPTLWSCGHTAAFSQTLGSLLHVTWLFLQWGSWILTCHEFSVMNFHLFSIIPSQFSLGNCTVISYSKRWYNFNNFE